MNRRRKGIAAGTLAAAALALGGCELTSVEVAEPDDVIVVEAYLRTDAVRQEVFLYRTLSGNRSLEVEGAGIRVRRVDGGGPLRPTQLSFTPVDGDDPCARYSVFAEDEGGSCYRTEPAPDFVQPGGTYDLEVVLPDGRRLESRTTVPDDFGIRAPAPDSCVLEGPSYSFIWTRSEGAWAYQALARFSGLAAGLRERGVEDPPDQLDLLGLAVGAADTTIAFPEEFGVFDRFTLDRDLLLALQEGLPAGARADVLVAAGDRNFVNWVRGGNFNPSGQVRVPSVTGEGTGVFGSLVVRGRTLLTEPDGTGIPSCP